MQRKQIPSNEPVLRASQDSFNRYSSLKASRSHCVKPYIVSTIPSKVYNSHQEMWRKYKWKYVNIKNIKLSTLYKIN